MGELEDLGAKFGRDKTFCFDHLIIEEIIFDDTNDVTLYCQVPYFGKMYCGNFGLTFEQLNIILRHTREEGADVVTALADKLDGEVEIPSVLELPAMFGKMLEIKDLILYTTLYDVQAEIEDEENLDEDGEPMHNTYEAFAFLVDSIEVKGSAKQDTPT